MAKSWLTRSYNFIDKDPEIDRFRTIWQQEQMGYLKESDLAVLAGLSPSTVKNMFGGETRRPQHSTVAKMAGAMNYEYGLQRMKPGPDYKTELPKAREEFKAHKAALAKKRERAAKKNGRKS
jgi:transcriptional regulator with XRE-family HTH domain